MVAKRYLPAETFETGRGLLTLSLAKPRQNAEANLSRLFVKTHIYVTRVRRKNTDTQLPYVVSCIFTNFSY
jgi:hypothetical protein